MLNRNDGKSWETGENQESEWMTTKEAARYLGISPNALRILVCRKRVKFYKLESSPRFKLNDLQSLILPKAN